jgi:hypothetical protein
MNRMTLVSTEGSLTPEMEARKDTFRAAEEASLLLEVH